MGGRDDLARGGFGPLLRTKRLAAGLTQEELAGQAGLSVWTVGHLERGVSRPYRRTVTLLADALGLDEAGRAELATAARPAPPFDPGAAEVSPPRQLPAAVTDFVGREAELETLHGLLDQPGGPVVISTIAGTAGVGKTALAVRWAHQAAARFPDGQLYVNLRGYDPDQPMPVADALAGFLRALGVPGLDIPPGTDERAARYRSLLAGRRMLVLLDNASAVEQMRPLLPGSPSCAVVVTSRDALAGLVARDGARRLALDLLPPDEAARLLRALIGERAAADPDATAALAGLCARLPLALRVAAEHVIARPSVTLAGLVDELADQQRRLDLLDTKGDPRTAVRALFSWSCQRLDPAAARAFRLLGLHSGPDLDVYAAAALTGTAVEQAGRLLDRLAAAYLIQSAEPGRYGMHDLLRAYARELAAAQDGEDEQQAALTRLFDHFLQTAAAAMDLLYPAERDIRPRITGPPVPAPSLTSPAAALAWLDGHLTGLTAAAGHAAAHGWPDHATRLAMTLFRYLDIGGHAPEATVIQGHALHAARSVGDRTAEAIALASLGTSDWGQGRYRQAASLMQQSLALCRETGDRAGEARALAHLGLVYTYLCRYRRAVSHLQQSLAVCREIGHRMGEARVLNMRGVVELRQGRYGQAADSLRTALALCRELGNRFDEACTLDSLGRLDLRQGRYGQAASHCREALVLFREMGGNRGEANAEHNLGCVDLLEGRYGQAAGHCQRALALYRANGYESDAAEVLASLGSVELRRGRAQQAAEFGREALAMSRERDDLGGEAAALNVLGEVALAAGHADDALGSHRAALGLARRIGDTNERARAHDGLGRTYHAVGDPGQARHHWQQALTLYTALGAPQADQVRTQPVTGRLL